MIGAGPAGLLFVIAARLLAEKASVVDGWTIRLFDKRESYARTHRLRMDPAPYRAMQRALDDPRFDALVTLLDTHGFTPEVNVLEAALSELAASLGVKKEKREITDRDGLLALRREIEGRVTIVAADSVHSVVRAIAGAGAPTHATHERLARLRVRGEALPRALGLVDRVRVSKVLGSIVDYRLNRNGYAEVDLFLTTAEHEVVREVGATPRAPVKITSRSISRLRAPLFRAIVEHLETGLGGAHEVEVQSTFELEHTVMPNRVLAPADLDAAVFLVGDAAVSLPFFRGMASLASCAHALAGVHVDVALGNPDADTAAFRARHPSPIVGVRPLPGEIVEVHATTRHGLPAFVILHRWALRWGVHVVREDGARLYALRSVAPVREEKARAELAAQIDPARRYDLESGEIIARELGVVRARARLVRATREAFRVAAMLPFPIQTWVLRARDPHPERDRATPGLFINTALAIAAVALVALGSPWIAACAIPVQLIGGASYRGALALESSPHRWVARVWAAQIVALFVLGVSAAAREGWLALTWWFALAIPFVIGMLLFERFAGRDLRAAGFEQ